jgi:signal peptidase I
MDEVKYRQAAIEAIEAGLQKGGVARFQVVGGSMRPYLEVGDWLLLESGPASDIALGDIVIVKRAQDVCAHRVIGKRPGGWITKGDALYQPDPDVMVEAILGRVIGLERKGSTIDLMTGSRRMIHRWTARLSALEARIYQIAAALNRRALDGLKISWATPLLKVLISPLRLLTRFFAP